MPQPTRSKQIATRLMEVAHNCELENEDMKDIIECLSQMLSLKTYTNFAKSEKITYPAAKKRKTNKVIINNVTFIIDNE